MSESNKRETKIKWVKNALSRGWIVNAIKAFEGCGLIRLTDVIFDLRKAGWQIESRRVDRRYGRYYMNYKLISKPKE